jgi:NADH-quinone oxidoreductase subunit E
VLAGFNDGRADEGVSSGPASLAGLELAGQRGERSDESIARGGA